MKINYNEKYLNLLKEKFPEKLDDPKIQWKLSHLNSFFNIIEFNDLLFHDGNRNFDIIDSCFSFDTQDELIRILKYKLRFKKAKDGSGILDFAQDSGKVILLPIIDTLPNNPTFGSLAFDKVKKSMVI